MYRKVSFIVLLVKDEITKSGGVGNISIGRPLIKSMHEAHSKSLIAENKRREQREDEIKKKNERAKLEKENEEQLNLDSKIRYFKLVW